MTVNIPPELAEMEVKLCGCYGSPGYAGLPIEKFKRGLKSETGDIYTPLCDLPLEMADNHYIGDITVLTIANPLHFLAKRVYLVTIVLP